MFLPKKKIALSFCCLIALISLSGSATGYVLPGPFILELMIKHYGKAKRLLVHQTLKIYRQPLQNDHADFDETLRFISRTNFVPIFFQKIPTGLMLFHRTAL
ncbi:MAG: hypothetical protein ACE5DO_10335 [Desulfobacterales bacterium]